jgi:hypothetical protein
MFSAKDSCINHKNTQISQSHKRNTSLRLKYHAKTRAQTRSRVND